ncbi:hypothetical protein NDU88_003387 [Pleurodeles waltl]|uniref:Uncharacterized protein n=1 Tax=Pleurodeles waltl TaxID=8319 RepID=A0AAV7LF69_PLEWA|nr:hypothetical protein NDU88_003387 [Pleurodeles waltl]
MRELRARGCLEIPIDHSDKRNRLGGPAPIPNPFGNPADSRASHYSPLDQLLEELTASTQNGDRSYARRTEKAERISAAGEVSAAWGLAAGGELSRQSTG